MRAAGFVALAVIGLALRVEASPLEMFGFGARSPALAETGIASADDFEALYLNPAGLAFVTGSRLTAGTLFGSFSLSGVDRPIDDAVAIEIGLAVRLPLGGILEDRVGLGIGLYLPTELVVRARTPPPGTPLFVVLENRSQVIGIQFGAGVRVTDRLSLGGGILALASLTGVIDVTAGQNGAISSISEAQVLASFAPVFGARYRLTDAVRLGASLHLPSESKYDTRVHADLGSTVPLRLPEFRIAGSAQYDPLSIAVEAAWRPRPDLLLTGQLELAHWSAFPLPTENVLANAPAQEPPDFHDTVVPRVAAEWTLGDYTLRGGYAFVPTPAPEATGAQAFVDNSRHVFSLGAGIVAAPLHVDAWAQAHVLVERTNQRPDGALTTSGSILAAGMTVGVDL